MKYGIPYKGSKTKIAKDILSVLPSGNRLVDLFGGGFAITHCAMLEFPDKWNRFYYNDKNPLLPPLLRDAMAGKYNYNNFHPKWISREEFHEKKNTDGYVKWIWSFGNNGQDYLFGKSIEDSKRKVHEFVVDGIESDITQGITLKSDNIHDRRLEWKKAVRGISNKPERLEQIERLQQLERFERLQNVENVRCRNTYRLELHCHDYKDYEYMPGDVVYCDIPYHMDAKPTYDVSFDYNDFLKWAKAQPYTVYFSLYSDGFVLWQKQQLTPFNTGAGQVPRIEILYGV